jgi:transposase
MVTLRAKGATCRTIALRLGISERTVQRWLRTGHFPERRRRSERPGQLGRYTAYLQARWAEGGHHATRLHQELQARGFHGSYGSVAAWVAAWREQHYRHRGQIRTRQPPHLAADGLATPRRVCWLLLRPEGDLTHAEREFRSHLYTACPQVATAQELVKEFARVFRERDVGPCSRRRKLLGRPGFFSTRRFPQEPQSHGSCGPVGLAPSGVFELGPVASGGVTEMWTPRLLPCRLARTRCAHPRQRRSRLRLRSDACSPRNKC